MKPFIVDPSEVKREGYRFFTETAMTLRARDYKDVRMAAIPSGFKSTYQEVEREIEMNGFSVNDFFCGAGGMGLGFKQAGFEIKGAWDFDKYAVESYKHNVGDHVEQADISKMDFMDLPFADVWTFGFPCQDLSVAGKQAGMIKGVTRSGLFFEIVRLLNEVRDELSFDAMPKIIMAENVKGLKKFLPVLEEEYEAAGYKMYLSHQNKGVLNSKYWGVPQNRERYFVVGVRKDIDKEFTFPEQQTDFIPKLSSVLEDNVDEKYYVSDEKAQSVLNQVMDPNKEVGRTLRVGGKGSLSSKHNYEHIKIAANLNHYGNDQMNRIYSPEGVSPTALVVSGGGREIKILEGVVKNHGQLRSVTDGVATCCDANYFKGPDNHGQRTLIQESPVYRVRKLTPREYARLQGFPDSYEQIVSNSQFYKQMGNAVTVNVARAIAERIQEFLKEL